MQHTHRPRDVRLAWPQHMLYRGRPNARSHTGLFTLRNSTIMSRPGLLVVPAFGLDLTLEHYLASLRTSVGIARALSGSLLLPRFCNVPSHNLVDVKALRAIVPLISESQARTIFVDVAAETEQSRSVRVVTAGSDFDPAPLVEDCLSALGAFGGLARQSKAASLAWRSAAPLRSRADIQEAFALVIDPSVQVLILAALPAALLSASATVRVPDRAFAMPASRLRRLADRVASAAMEAPADAKGMADLTAQIEAMSAVATYHGLSDEAGKEEEEDDDDDHHDEDEEEREATDGSRQQPSGHRIGLVLVTDADVPTSVAIAAEAASLLIDAQPHIWQPTQPSQQQQQPPTPGPGPGVLVIDAMLLRGSSGGDCVTELNAALPLEEACESQVAVSLAAALHERGYHARALPRLPFATDNASSDGGRRMRNAALACALRWLCSNSPLLLLPPIASAPPGLVTARQALGRPVDHAYVPKSGDALPLELYVPLPSSSLEQPACPNPHAPPRPHPPPPTTASLATLLETARMASAGVDVSDVDRGASPSDAPTATSAIPATLATSLTAIATARQSAPPPPPPALSLYESFLDRTLPKLQRLPFAPPPLRSLYGGGRVAVMIEPRATESIVRRAAYVIRNVGVLLNAEATGMDEQDEGDTAAPNGANGRGGWSVQFFHGTSNLEKVAAHFSEEEWSRVTCESLGVDNLSSSQEYSSLLTSHWFWSRVGAEYVLIVQEDALLCTGPMQGLRTVGEVSDAYDYAGAPWEPYDGWVRGKAWLNSVGGNGGLSLRRRSQALACLDLAPWQPKQWEDAYFVERLQQLGHRVMPAGRARHFAVEREYGFEPRPCGVHKVYNYLPPEKLMLILTELERRYDAIAAAVARCCR